MKIALITDKMGIGGAESHIYTLARELVKMGHSPVVLSSGGILSRKLKKEGIRQIKLPLVSKNPLTLIAERSMLYEIFKREKFDIVHAHARLASFVSAPICERLSIPFITTAHAMFKMSPLKSSLSRFGEYTICVSEDIGELIKDKAEGLCIIENGVSKRPAIKAIGGQGILFVSRMDSDCSLGAELLCRIAPRLIRDFPSLKITLVGGGDNFEWIKKQAEKANELCKKEVVFAVGASSAPQKHYKENDLFIGVSRASLEAMSAGLPCILLGNEGYLGLLDESKLDLARKSNFCARGEGFASEKALEGEIKKFFSLTIKEREAIGYRLRNFVLENYSAKDMAEKTVAVYKRVINQVQNAPKRVLICGYYGFGNLGDDAILQSIASRFKLLSPKTQIIAMTKNGKADNDFYGIRCIDRLDFANVLAEMKACDLFIFGGGSLLQDKTSVRSLAYYLFIIFLSGIYCKRTVMLSNGIGPFLREGSELLSLCLLDNFDTISVRDSISLDYLNNATKQKAYLLPDVVFMNDYEIKKERGDGCFALCMSLDYEKYLPLLLPLIKRIYSELGLKPILTVLNLKKDASALPKIYKVIEECCGRVEYVLNQNDCIRLFSSAEFVLSMRLHGLIFSAITGTVPVALGNDTKLFGFCRELLLREPFSENDSVENVFSYICETLCSKEEMQKNISERVAFLKEEARQGFSETVLNFKE